MEKKKGRGKKWLIGIGSVWLFFYICIKLGEMMPPQPKPQVDQATQTAAAKKAYDDAEAVARAQVDAQVAEWQQKQIAIKQKAEQQRKEAEDAAFWKNKEALDSQQAADYTRARAAEYVAPTPAPSSDYIDDSELSPEGRELKARLLRDTEASLQRMRDAQRDREERAFRQSVAHDIHSLARGERP